MIAEDPRLRAGLPDELDTSSIVWGDARPWPRLDERALHGVAGDVVRMLRPHTEADPAALLFQFLTGAGNLIGRSAYVSVGAVRHEPRLFVAIVGASAKARKGQSWSEAAAVLRQADPNGLEAAHISGLASGEGLIARLRDPEDGVSVEKRGLVVEAEFARVLAAAGRDGSTLSAILRDAWDGGTLSVLTRKDPLVARDSYISFIAHITQDELEAKLTSVDVSNGFANRFMFICARRARMLPSGGNLSFDDLASMGRNVAHAFDRARRLGEMKRTPAFAAAWEWLYARFPDEPGQAGAIVARAEAHVLRLSVLYAALDGDAEIGAEHLLAAYAAWAYAANSARYVFGARLTDDVEQRLLDEIRAVYPDGLDRTQQRDAFARHSSEARMKRAREQLLAKGVAREESSATGGRPRHVLFAVPRDESAKSDESDEGATLSALSSLIAPSQGEEEGEL